MTISREDVIWIYKIFLGREPESEDVIAHQVNSGKSRIEMISQIIESEEFIGKHIVC